MILDKIKAIPFIDESAAVKVISVDGKISLERTDRVIWARESTNLESDGIHCYVEAKPFFALFDEIKELKQSTHLEVVLKNGAEYQLPFVDVVWDEVEMPETYHDRIMFKISDLMLTTLRNLIKPELQCIWIDEKGSVSTDIISACVSKEVKSSHPFLLPLDVQELVEGKIADVNAETGTLYIKGNNFNIAITKPENEDEWYNDIRGLLEGNPEFVPIGNLVESIKRLELFDDYISFNGEVVRAGSNYEPFAFKDLEDNLYDILKLHKIAAVSTSIGEINNNLVLMNEGSVFLLASMEEA